MELSPVKFVNTPIFYNHYADYLTLNVDSIQAIADSFVNGTLGTQVNFLWLDAGLDFTPELPSVGWHGGGGGSSGAGYSAGLVGLSVDAGCFIPNIGNDGAVSGTLVGVAGGTGATSNSEPVAGNGGAGGDLGFDGKAGTNIFQGASTYTGGNGGSAGRAIVSTEFVTFIDAGDIRGEIDSPNSSALLITEDTQDLVLSEFLISEIAWNEIDPVIVTIDIGINVLISASSVNTSAFIVNGLPEGSVITLINNGLIVGAGGKGGDGSIYFRFDQPEPGSNGGNALTVNSAAGVLLIDNKGLIAGGGGGGGGGAPSYSNPAWYSGAGGGGGAGKFTGSGGIAVPAQYASAFRQTFGLNGSNGTLLLGGNGGVNSSFAGFAIGGVGGKGGNVGSNGGNGGNRIQGQSSFAGATAGLAGNAVVGIGNVTWIDQGDTRGNLI